MNQDFVAWVGQNTISDRWNEHLGESDRGVIMMRRKMIEQAEVVADGGEPKELIRDAALNESVGLPIVGRDRLRIGERTRGTGDGPQGTFGRGQVPPGGFQAGTVGREFVFQAGQPAAVRQAYREAMGIVD